LQAELAVAKKFEGETVAQFRANPIGGVKGDIDVVTNVRAYEVKVGAPKNLVFTEKATNEFRGQLARLTLYASDKGKSPVVAFQAGFFPLPKDVTDMLDEFNVVAEAF
jgi:hypothetical protein